MNEIQKLISGKVSTLMSFTINFLTSIRTEQTEGKCGEIENLPKNELIIRIEKI